MSQKIPPFKKNHKFYNSLESHPESFLFGTVPSFVKALWHRRNHQYHHAHEWIDTSSCVVPSSQQLQITWLGHATFLIQVQGINIITDPIFGHLSLLFPRILPVGIAPDQLPGIDLVLISHNHRDHLDEASVQFLKSKNPALTVLAGQGDKQWFDRRGFVHVKESTWWQQHEVVNDAGQSTTPVSCTFLPAWHWSQRGLFDKNKSLWGSWMIQAGEYTLYFAGDTAYSPHFKEISYHFPQIQVALMPIGPCEPHDWMKHTHLSAAQSVQAFSDLKAQHFIPMHWGTFGFGHDHFDLPIERLRQAWTEHAASRTDIQLNVVKAGQPVKPVILG